MIIVKDKAKNTKVYIQRTAVNSASTPVQPPKDPEVVVSGSSIVELRQSDYDELVRRGAVDEDTLYMITDANVSLPYLTGEQMVEYVDDMVGDINKILEDIIG